MDDIVRRMPWSKDHNIELLLEREWLVTNGLGGYASGTLAGAATRRYHGLLIASLPAPSGRIMMLNHLQERVRLADGTAIPIGGEERAHRDLEIHGAEHLQEFRLENGLPVWRYNLNGSIIEKRILMPHMQNTTYVNYRFIEGHSPVCLELRPSMHFRPHGASVGEALPHPYMLTVRGDHYEVTGGENFPPLRLYLYGNKGALTLDGGRLREVFYRVEADRGYESRGQMWSPGFFEATLERGHDATLVASTEEWQTVQALAPPNAVQAERERCHGLVEAADQPLREGFGAELVLAADQFIITPAGRLEHEARAKAAGGQVFTVIAGYYWFTDWGRDTMISLEGLTLCTHRYAEAAWILRLFADYIRDGLIPNLFPEGSNEGLYHTADATLWFFHSLDRYFEATHDETTLRYILPKLLDVVEHHVRGTRFGIGVDPADGLLREGQEGYQLTWMDAKVDGWVVTPRRGKAVEINALWYNALKTLEAWMRMEHNDAKADELSKRAEQARQSFNKRFWYGEGQYLFDVVDGEKGDDPSLRPNQVFAISLKYPILDRDKWEPVMKVVQEKLLTPVGLRSLAPGSPEYKPKYFGDLRARDAAYHQGTVWAWLIGPYIDAWLCLHPGDLEGARRLLDGFRPAMDGFCVGTIGEIFDAEKPFTPRGCIAQAWSVAEVLRSWNKTARKQS